VENCRHQTRDRVWNSPAPFVVTSEDVRATVQLADAEIVRRFQTTGDGAWFAELFARHRKHVYFGCWRFFSEGGAAEDATQETFLRAYQHMQDFSEGDVRAWLMRIARNVCIDHFRKARPERTLAQDQYAEPEAGGSVDDDFQMRTTVERLRKELAALPVDQRRCLEMKIEGYSYEETASRLGVSEKAVKSHIQNGRRMLWVKMKDILPGQS
jgi:RNA polymerase sigma-70 factor (ECF subfamily)